LKNDLPHVEWQIEGCGGEGTAPGHGFAGDCFGGGGCESLSAATAYVEEETGGAGLVAAVVHGFGTGSCAAVAWVDS